MFSLQKTKPTSVNNLSQLQAEINANVSIIPACTGIDYIWGQSDVNLHFTAPLSGPEETELEAVIAAHVPLAEDIDVNLLPFSNLDGKKLSVHQSTKPLVDGISTYAVWAGAGDDPITGEIGGGQLLDFHMTPGNPTVSIDVKFDHVKHGRVWIHEGYLRFTNGGMGDYASADIVGKETNLQQVANLDLLVSDDWVTYAPGGPGTGTHGFADANIVLIPRTFSHDGDWDYNGQSLTPNMSGTGEYKISSVERIVHRYINKIPCCGSSPNYFTMSSEETTELPANYFMRVTMYNVSDSTWEASVIMEIYRERTHVP